MPDDDIEVLRAEFDRAAAGFAERTKGRFDAMDAPSFSRIQPNESIVEVGCGTGNFLQLFKDKAARCIGLDITPGMLAVAREQHPEFELVLGDARKLPFRSGSIDVVASAQAFHHIWDPVPVLLEMRRVAGPGGRVLIVDQYTTERYEEATIMNQLEVIRDPSHAVSRPPSAFRIMVRSAGLEIVDEHLWEGTNRFSQWMWPGEFPEERIAAVRTFIEKHGPDTGMNWTPEGPDWTFTRRRIMLLAEWAR